MAAMHTTPCSARRRRSAAFVALAAAALGPLAPLPAGAATPADLLAQYSAAAASPPSAARGERFFADRHGREWSCASCHCTPPLQNGKHASTGKAIEPLAPAANPRRFSDEAKVEKWFRRNCNDVLGRECSAGEKADLIAWLATLKP
jgi:cytochrome c peroxidase